MTNKTNKKVSLINIITTIILIFILFLAWNFYLDNNFNDFLRSEAKLRTSKFLRDDEVKYSNIRSYKIESNEYNDAMFSKEIEVEKNTPYKVTCMVKTDNVEPEKEKTDAGAQISISDTTEKSISISGTHDWQKLEFVFNSKNRDKVDIAFRLGGVDGNARGKVWFSDFSIEKGNKEENNDWNYACFIFKNTSVNIDGKQININVTDEDIRNIKDTIKRFEKSCNTLSKGKMKANCDIHIVYEPVSTLSYDEEFGYYLEPKDIEPHIKDIINQNNYDHIFAIVRLGNDKYMNEIEVKDWIGLGSMDYYGIGFSNIRLPNASKSYTYKYKRGVNEFPEEVFLHEFLHSLERTAKESGYKIPALHDYEKYGYADEKLVGQKKWYMDYMNKEIETDNGKIGLPAEIYNMKPAKNLNFEYSYKLNEYKEPQNFIEEVQQIFNKVCKTISELI